MEIYEPTQEELALERESDDEYNAFTDPDTVAAKRNQFVVYPEPNQLQIDIDTDSQYAEFKRRLEAFDGFWTYTIEDKPSASGLPHRHITITIPGRRFTDVERIAYQAALNDDPIRVFLNTFRLESEIPNPTRFFEPL